MLQAIAAQVCMDVYNKPMIFDSLQIEECIVLSVQLTCLFYLQVKINHDTHEFILNFGTAMNSTYVHEKNIHPIVVLHGLVH